MVGGAAMLADGVLTPAVTVTTAVEGLTESLNRRMHGGGRSRFDDYALITSAIITGIYITVIPYL